MPAYNDNYRITQNYTGYNSNVTGYDPYRRIPIEQQAQYQHYAMPTQTTLLTVPVTSDDEVVNYPVAAGVQVILIDFNRNVFFLKSTSINGVPNPIRKFPFKEESTAPAPQTTDPNGIYVTKKDFDEMSKKLSDLIDKLGGEN